jgi:hypothetical protein
MTLALEGSTVTTTGEVWRFTNSTPPHGASRTPYTNAQIDDYQGLRRRDFRWKAPLTLTVRARFSSDHPQGTAGFGFWNDPFLMTGFRMPALPRAVWFFYGAGPHHNLKLAKGVSGHGWKCATIDAIRPAFFALAPTAPLAVPLMNIDAIYERLWPIGQRAIGVSEAELPGGIMTAWHTYTLEWREGAAAFFVDGERVHRAPTAPRGRLGFVMWIDNQALTLTPWGAFGWRTLPIEGQQWMEVSQLAITPG